MFGWLTLGNVIVPVMVLMVVGALVAVVRIVSRNYVKVAPNEVAVIYGRKYKTKDGQTRGFRLVTGGAAFVIPLLEQYQILPLDAFQIKFTVNNVPSGQGVRITVDAVATLKIGREEGMLEAAVSRFLKRHLNEIKQFAQEVMEGGLRGVVATMTVEDLVRERTKFGNIAQEGVTGDLEKLGLVLDNFIIQDIRDEQGYIDALGKKQTAYVKRDASIAEAQAKRDQEIEVAQAQREADEKASESRKSGEKAKADAAQQISNFERERDVIAAGNTAKVQAEQAKIKIAAEIAAAQKEKELRVARVEAEQAEIEAKIILQEKEKERKDAELKASKIVEAERGKEAIIIDAEGRKRAAELTAEAERIKVEQAAEAMRVRSEKEGEGIRLHQTAEAEGRKAAANAKQKELEAEAAGNQAKLQAEAVGIQAKLQAEAAGIQAKLQAEAVGIEKKAEAYRKLDQAGKLLIILEHLPEIIESTGKAIKEAGEGTLAPIAQAIGTGLSGIEEVRLIDLGGGKGGDSVGTNLLSQVISTIPDATFQLVQRSKALGVDKALQTIAQQFGLDLGPLFKESPQHHKTEIAGQTATETVILESAAEKSGEHSETPDHTSGEKDHE